MKHIVITIGRELGCGGKEIAEKIADRLGIKFYDKKLLEAAARESGIDTTIFEEADEKESHTFIGNMFSIHGSLANVLSGVSCFDEDKLFEIQSEAIRNIAAKESCIIVGRCAEYILRDHPDLISIFITADNEERVKRIMKSEGLEHEKAVEFIEKSDRRRRQYHDYYATTKWGEAHSYDLCINSSRLGIDGTVDAIQRFVCAHYGL